MIRRIRRFGSQSTPHTPSAEGHWTDWAQVLVSVPSVPLPQDISIPVFRFSTFGTLLEMHLDVGDGGE